MQISPRYEGPAILTFVDGADVRDAFLRQRRRIQTLFSTLGDGDWDAPTRCVGWTVQDLAAHLDGVNRFFHRSITAGLSGEPTRMLVGFDPKATPAAMVAATRSATPAETLSALVESNDELCELVAGLDDEQWATITEAPPGLLPVHMLVHHALWDSWVHERDMGIPLGLTLTEEADEVMATLRYVASFGPAVALTLGTASPAVLVVESTEPDRRLVVEVTDRVVVHDQPVADPRVVLRDTAVNLVEALSVRAPLTYAVSEADLWLVDTLGTVFETR